MSVVNCRHNFPHHLIVINTAILTLHFCTSNIHTLVMFDENIHRNEIKIEWKTRWSFHRLLMVHVDSGYNNQHHRARRNITSLSNPQIILDHCSEYDNVAITCLFIAIYSFTLSELCVKISNWLQPRHLLQFTSSTPMIQPPILRLVTLGYDWQSSHIPRQVARICDRISFR